MATKKDPWIVEVEKRMKSFADKYSHAYAKTQREQSGFFEIGCFLTLADDYASQGFEVTTENPDDKGAYRYLTSPNGNPRNFSFLRIVKQDCSFDLRQQVRVRSPHHDDIAFTPDMAVLASDAAIEQKLDPDYANGKRGMYAVSHDNVQAIHECKSLTGFPELYVSFIGMLAVLDRTNAVDKPPVGHLASTLFVGGVASSLHLRMIAALQKVYPMNIVTGMHRGAWVFNNEPDKLIRI